MENYSNTLDNYSNTLENYSNTLENASKNSSRWSKKYQFGPEKTDINTLINKYLEKLNYSHTINQNKLPSDWVKKNEIKKKLHKINEYKLYKDLFKYKNLFKSNTEIIDKGKTHEEIYYKIIEN